MMSVLAKIGSQVRRRPDDGGSRQRLAALALDAEMRGQRRVSERLHDTALQMLAAVRQDLDEGAYGDAAALRRATSGVESTIAELRGIVSELHPAVADQLGLGPALKAIALDHSRRHGFKLDLEVAHDAAGGDDAVLLMLARELLANAGTHGRPSFVRVRVVRVRAHLVLEVQDDGCGFDELTRLRALRRGHIGLAAAKERVEGLGGHFEVETAPDCGTTVRVRLPANRERRRFRRIPAVSG